MIKGYICYQWAHPRNFKGGQTLNQPCIYTRVRKTRQASQQIPHLFLIKTLCKPSTEGNFLSWKSCQRPSPPRMPSRPGCLLVSCPATTGGASGPVKEDAERVPARRLLQLPIHTVVRLARVHRKVLPLMSGPYRPKARPERKEGLVCYMRAKWRRVKPCHSLVSLKIKSPRAKPR